MCWCGRRPFIRAKPAAKDKQHSTSYSQAASKTITTKFSRCKIDEKTSFEIKLCSKITYTDISISTVSFSWYLKSVWTVSWSSLQDNPSHGNQWQRCLCAFGFKVCPWFLVCYIGCFQFLWSNMKDIACWRSSEFPNADFPVMFGGFSKLRLFLISPSIFERSACVPGFLYGLWIGLSFRTWTAFGTSCLSLCSFLKYWNSPFLAESTAN